MSKRRADRIGKFWVVTRPRSISVLADILFQADVQYMALQYAGGLDPKDVVGIYYTKRVAEKKAKALLKAVRG